MPRFFEKSLLFANHFGGFSLRCIHNLAENRRSAIGIQKPNGLRIAEQSACRGRIDGARLSKRHVKISVKGRIRGSHAIAQVIFSDMGQTSAERLVGAFSIEQGVRCIETNVQVKAFGFCLLAHLNGFFRRSKRMLLMGKIIEGFNGYSKRGNLRCSGRDFSQGPLERFQGFSTMLGVSGLSAAYQLDGIRSGFDTSFELTKNRIYARSPSALIKVRKVKVSVILDYGKARSVL